MRFLSTKAHGILDYLTGLLLIASPWIFGFSDIPAATFVPVILGISAILYSLLTDYEMGAYRKIPMKTHLTIDFVSGLFLAVSPWLIGFDDQVYLPHLILGIFEMGASMVTETSPSRRTAHDDINLNR